jgi:hypothetical protein
MPYENDHVSLGSKTGLLLAQIALRLLTFASSLSDAHCFSFKLNSNLGASIFTT